MAAPDPFRQNDDAPPPPPPPPHHRLSPVLSRRDRQHAQPQPATPGTPVAETETSRDYFGSRLSATPSVQSRLSSRSPNRLSAAFPPAAPAAAEPRRQPSIRIRRRNSNASNASRDSWNPQNAFAAPQLPAAATRASSSHAGGRPRSISQPERAAVPDNRPASFARSQRRGAPQVAMPRLTEEGSRPTMDELGMVGSPVSPTVSLPEPATVRTYDTATDDENAPPPRKRLQRMRNASRIFRGSRRPPETEEQIRTRRLEDEYGEQLVDWLDTIDPEVQTLSTLTNVQNSLFVPDLGNWLNRRPTYNLTRHDIPPEQRPPQAQDFAVVDRMPPPQEQPEQEQQEAEQDPYAPAAAASGGPSLERSNTITSRLTDSHYAALPHGTTLEGWTAYEKWELEDHVRHMLHSRRARFKRTMKGFGQYVRQPLGFLVTLYATLITLFGLAWVLFLIGWIYVGDPHQQDYVIFIIDSVLVALFAVMGIGLAPFRAVDTYRMLHIVYYNRIIEKAKQGIWPRPRSRLQKDPPADVLQELEKTDTLASALDASRTRTNRTDRAQGGGGGGGGVMGSSNGSDDALAASHSQAAPGLAGDGGDLDGKSVDDEDVFPDPLTPKQRKKFEHHQKKLSRSHSFYKPHETFTHYSFPLKFLIAIVILVDCHSCLQISLSSCTWGIDYHTRPFAITTVILCVSITANISAGIVIMVGDRKTRKKDIHNLMDRQEITGDAIKHLEHKRKKEHEKSESEEGSSSRERKIFKAPPPSKLPAAELAGSSSSGQEAAER